MLMRSVIKFLAGCQYGQSFQAVFGAGEQFPSEKVAKIPLFEGAPFLSQKPFMIKGGSPNFGLFRVRTIPLTNVHRVPTIASTFASSPMRRMPGDLVRTDLR